MTRVLNFKSWVSIRNESKPGGLASKGNSRAGRRSGRKIKGETRRERKAKARRELERRIRAQINDPARSDAEGMKLIDDLRAASAQAFRDLMPRWCGRGRRDWGLRGASDFRFWIFDFRLGRWAPRWLDDARIIPGSNAFESCTRSAFYNGCKRLCDVSAAWERPGLVGLRNASELPELRGRRILLTCGNLSDEAVGTSWYVPQVTSGSP